MAAIRHLGTTGHFCGGDACRFHLHTHAGHYCISTLGEYYPPSANGKMERVGSSRFYETMVFDLKRSERRGRWQALDFNAYNSRRAAEAGHDELVRGWSRRAK